MTIKNYATVVLATSVCLALGAVAYSIGGIRQLLNTDPLIVAFAICLPFFVLWAAASGAKGTGVSRTAVAISVAFILLDTAVYVGLGAKFSGSNGSIVIAAIASVEMILSLLMVVGAVVSRARWEGGESIDT